MEYTKGKLFWLVLLRMAIGWHFFYEGMVKVLNPAWTAKAYLMDSGGFMKPFFEWIAFNPSLLAVSDFVNAWGLALIGFFLLLGWLVKPAAIGGMILLGLYYFSHPPFPGIEYLFPVDGSYFIIDKTLVELVALGVVLSFPTAHLVGLERLLKKSGTFSSKSYGSGKQG